MSDHAADLPGSVGDAQRAGDASGVGSRRRASRSLWSACEALLSSDGKAMQRALDDLAAAFDCDGVALWALGASGTLEPWCARGEWTQKPGDLRACLSVPLVRGEEAVGTLELIARAQRGWSAAQFGLVRTAAGALGAALGARLELQRLRHQPGRDAVTGLPDGAALRARLAEELQRARRSAQPLGLVMLDLDHFDAVQRRVGRPTAERVLAEVALVLRLALRESDVVARMAGDQFAVILPETEPIPARRVAERLGRALEEHRFERVGPLTASCGVATSPQQGSEALELMDQAERALGLAKKDGRRRVSSAASARRH